MAKTTLSNRLTDQFRYTEEQFAPILALCSPTDEWIKENQIETEIESSGALRVQLLIERIADRFLHHTLPNLSPKPKKAQRDYLEAIDRHTTALLQLLAGVTDFDGGVADPFKLMEKISKKRGKAVSSFEHRDLVMQTLLPLQLVARMRLQTDLVPRADEEQEEAQKRRNTFPRLCFIADLLAAYQRVTGKEPMATLHGTKAGTKMSEAVEFACLAANPVLKAARQGSLNPESARKEIQTIKALWKEGVSPEMTYLEPDWGKHSGRFR
ncbi:hypothetical protein [Agrobacterium pusense]|uniref:hypothetical protein n=1 Tax=Agrobacterium pusense TaxID=648995 RepID=UPI0010ADED18|nr:hypothetical protein [Agrobacterium pusense]WCK22969.1 hypothetical protein CFBP5496_0009405 [Agrobacterium pusense]